MMPNAQSFASLLCLGLTLVFCFGGRATAEVNLCSLTGIARSASISYPPIARAAHISGAVSLTVQFDSFGYTSAIEIQNGPAMLHPAVEQYLRSWHVNGTPDGQSCPIEILFALADPEGSCEDKPSVVNMSDLQHFTVTSSPTVTCDSATSDPVLIRHKFPFFHWYSHPRPALYA